MKERPHYLIEKGLTQEMFDRRKLMSNHDANDSDWMRAYRPFFFEEISGIAGLGPNKVLLCDRQRGMLAEVDLLAQTETFKKKYDVNDYAGVNSLAYDQGCLYSVYENKIYRADYEGEGHRLKNQQLVAIPNCSNLTGIAVTEATIYLVTERQSLLSYNRATGAIKTLAKSLGIGLDDLCYFDSNLLIVDAKEQTIYVFDLATEEFSDEILTPFENPTSLSGVYDERAQKEVLYVCYSRPSFEVYDTGDSEFKLQLDAPIADNFIYPLVYQRDVSKKAVRSNGFLVEMYYVEKLHALPEIADEYRVIKDLDWKISIPLNTDRQQLVSLEAMGDFEMRIEAVAEEENRPVAVFSMPEIDLKTERRVFGWKATLRLSGIRYCLPEDEVRAISQQELKQYAQYLQDEPGLDLNSAYVQKAAQEAVRHLSDRDRQNVLKKAKAIRDYIYAQLTYVMDRYHDGTEAVLRQAEGSCGEYLNVFLSLFRLNDIPVRKCGNYKVPAYKMQAGSRSVFLSPDFNHVWLQFYVPDLGWVPLESSADDESSAFREWAKRYFMSLAWYHVECRLGSYFEEVFDSKTGKRFFLAPGDLGKNDIKFRVICDLE
jgi:transglutaminase-like putative cysteine protease